MPELARAALEEIAATVENREGGFVMIRNCAVATASGRRSCGGRRGPLRSASNCTTADGMTVAVIQRVLGMSAYLFAHPDVNAFFSGLQAVAATVGVGAQTQIYLDVNPQIRADLDGIRQPSTDFRTRCNIGQRPLALGVL